MQHASTTHCFNFAQTKRLQEDQVKLPGVKHVGPVDFPGGQHALGNVGSWPAPGGVQDMHTRVAKAGLMLVPSRSHWEPVALLQWLARCTPSLWGSGTVDPALGLAQLPRNWQRAQLHPCLPAPRGPRQRSLLPLA